jgi:hypothetical protein
LHLLVWLGLYSDTIPDPIILSDNDDEFAGAESETDNSNLNADITAKSDSSSLYVADSDIADRKVLGSGAIYNLDRLVADY